MSEVNLKPRFEVHKLEGKATRQIASPKTVINAMYLSACNGDDNLPTAAESQRETMHRV